MLGLCDLLGVELWACPMNERPHFVRPDGPVYRVVFRSGSFEEIGQARDIWPWCLAGWYAEEGGQGVFARLFALLPDDPAEWFGPWALSPDRWVTRPDVMVALRDVVAFMAASDLRDIERQKLEAFCSPARSVLLLEEHSIDPL